MFVTALVLLTLVASGLLLALVRYLRQPQPAQAYESAFFSPQPHFEPLRPVFPSMEEAHASVSGALALQSFGTTRARPGHRCVEEVRRRCLDDFASAMNFLEGQLNRRVSENPVEQARYWIDMAEGLRILNLHESLPALLRRADDALSLPLADAFAIEVVSFTAFAEYLHDPLCVEGQAALRILRVAMESVRLGTSPPGVCAVAAFGDAVRRISENCPETANPRTVRVFLEALRYCRRNHHNAPEFRDDPVRRQTVRWQQAFMRDAEPIMREYLHEIGAELLHQVTQASGRAQLELLEVLAELRHDTEETMLSLLAKDDFVHREMAIRCLRWSKSASALTALCELARQGGSGERSGRWLRRLGVGKQEIPLSEVFAALEALRGHPSLEAERILLTFLNRPEPEWRLSALRSLGWWEPLSRGEVLAAIRTARQDEHPELRRAALAVSARLGECAALQIIRDGMWRENPAPVRDAIQLCGNEGLSWLWPELDALTEADDATIATEAWDAIERVREEFLGLLS